MSKVITRSFKINAPGSIVPIYETLQFELDQILNNRQIVNNLMKINLRNDQDKFRHKGYLEQEIKPLLHDHLTGKVPNAGWYRNILADNIINLLKSRDEQLKIYRILQENSFEINSKVRQMLHDQGFYPSNSYLKNLARTKITPTLPKHKIFQLDYTTSAKQMFIMDQDLLCKIRVMDQRLANKLKVDAWNEFQIYVPTYVRSLKIIKFCKPLFIKDPQTNRLVGQVAYQFEPLVKDQRTSILGVDLGRKKLYSASILFEDGHYSNEFVPSSELQNLHLKLNRIKDHNSLVYSKYCRAKEYFVQTSRQDRRYLDYQNNRKKLRRLRSNISWLVANEIITLALNYQCSEIHLEKLTWVNSTGGKWIFSLLQDKIKQLAEIHSIKVKLVSPAYSSKIHPITGEIGEPIGRKIYFSDGSSFDRDYLASINIAMRNSKFEVKSLVQKQKIKTKRKSRRKKNYQLKTSSLTSIEDNYIVMFSSNQDKALSITILNQNIRNLVNSLLTSKWLSNPLLI